MFENEEGPYQRLGLVSDRKCATESRLELDVSYLRGAPINLSAGCEKTCAILAPFVPMQPAHSNLSCGH